MAGSVPSFPGVARNMAGHPKRSLRYAEEPDRSREDPVLRNTSETGLVLNEETIAQFSAHPLRRLQKFPAADGRKNSRRSGRVGPDLFLYGPGEPSQPAGAIDSEIRC